MTISTALPLIFVGLGLAVAALTARTVLHARASAKWSHTPGLITGSKISQGHSTSFSPLVQYSYTVDGQPLTGKRICFGIARTFAGYQFAQSYTKRYPAGTEVTVYYDPAAPSEAVLEPGLTKRAFIPMAFALCFASFGGWFMLLQWLFRP